MKTKPTILEIIPLLKEYYELEENGVGGDYHIVLDDDNVRDDHVGYCLNEAIKKNDKLGIKIGKMLMKMSKAQRHKLHSLSYIKFGTSNSDKQVSYTCCNIEVSEPKETLVLCSECKEWCSTK